MKNFSAQNTEHKEFSLIEFRTELEGLEAVNSLPAEVKLLDMFTLVNEHFVMFITCKNLKPVYEELVKHPSVIDGYFTNDTIIESLNAFYYLNKAELSESLIVIETAHLSHIFRVMDDAHRSNLSIFDVKNQKSFMKNTLYVTGSKKQILSFEKNLRDKKDVNYKTILEINKTLLDFLN